MPRSQKKEECREGRLILGTFLVICWFLNFSQNAKKLKRAFPSFMGRGDKHLVQVLPKKLGSGKYFRPQLGWEQTQINPLIKDENQLWISPIPDWLNWSVLNSSACQNLKKKKKKLSLAEINHTQSHKLSS